MKSHFQESRDILAVIDRVVHCSAMVEVECYRAKQAKQ